jgi:hypothetical protein
MEWATLSEIRLYASILLSTKYEGSYLAVYPYRYPIYLRVSEPLDHQRTHRKIRAAIFDYMDQYSWQHGVFRGMSAPPAFGGVSYDLRNNAIRPTWQRVLYRQIDIEDHLLMRGLSTLLRASMLWQHAQFAEEAINTIYISLEASFSLILRILKARGVKNPTSKDAARFIRNAFFEETPEMRYFEEFYDNRVKSMHPESRFGLFPHAPAMIDDFIHLRDSLIAIYTYLLSGLIDPSLLKETMAQKNRSDGQMYGTTLQLTRLWRADPKRRR